MPEYETLYAIWSVKAGGWLTKSGNYSSEYANAKRVSRGEAIAACAVHVSEKNFGWLPVYCNDLDQIKDHKK